jgi:hypothetical protein
MSKKHLEEQKLLIENFNKWIKEAEESTEELETLSEEQLNEIIGVALVGKLLGAVWSALSFYDDLTDVNKQIQKRKDVPDELKKLSQEATDSLGTLKQRTGIVGKMATVYGHDLNPVAVKQNVAMAVLKRLLGSSDSEEETTPPEQSRDQQVDSFYKDMGIEENDNE